jgi:hypothetical protein
MATSDDHPENSPDEIEDEGVVLDNSVHDMHAVVRSTRRYLAQLLARFLDRSPDVFFTLLAWDEENRSSANKTTIVRKIQAALKSCDDLRGRILRLVDLDGKHGDRRFQVDNNMFAVIEGCRDIRDSRGDDIVCPHCRIADIVVAGTDLHTHLWGEKCVCSRLSDITGIFVRNAWERELHPYFRKVTDANGCWTYENAKVPGKYFGSPRKVRANKMDINDLFLGMGLRGERVL